MISAGLEGRLPYMTYPEPWGGPPKQPPEFLRPAPKPLPSTRYNGVPVSSLNGTRLGPPAVPSQQRSTNKYPSPPASVQPVNLVQHKEDVPEEIPYSAAYSRLFQPQSFAHFHHAGPYATLYQSPYTPILRPPNYAPPPPLSPLDTYTPTVTANATFLSPVSSFSPPGMGIKSNQVLVREKRPSPGFKVPSGKEGSLKHRILTRPDDPKGPLDLQKQVEALKIPEGARRRQSTTLSPPRSPVKPLNNNGDRMNFIRGSLIQLASGDLRKIEDLRTEDFVQSVERSAELRLADSTVVKIEENPITATTKITLSYNQRRSQIEFETALEHPFFVYGQGWASCAPERTFQNYGLKVHRLQVGDILISLTPRETTNPLMNRSSTIITTATTTAMTARQVSTSSGKYNHHLNAQVNQYYGACPQQHQVNNQMAHQVRLPSPDSAKKRRWSAPDEICDDNELNLKRVRAD